VPSARHESLIELFRHRPALAAELLAGALGVPVPAHEQARLDPGDLPELVPTEYRADAVVVLLRSGEPVHAVVVEVQLARDAGKRWSWPVYLATLRARLRCPVALLVVCVDAATARWCARPIELGHPGHRLAPLVVGPEQVPVVTTVEAGAVELTVLSAMAHGAGPARHDVLEALVHALATTDEDHLTLYSDLVLTALPAAARRHLEALMAVRTREYESDFVRKYVFQGRAEGKAEGKASAVLEVLETRGLDVPDDVRDRVLGCTDLDLLDVYLRRAVTAGSAAEVVA
jgi:hypothetical protein